MSILNDTSYGNLIIKFNIIYPKTLSDERKKYLDKILPGLKPETIQEKLYKYQDVEVKNAEIDNHDYTKDKVDDEEQDDFHSQKVECNQQ